MERVMGINSLILGIGAPQRHQSYIYGRASESMYKGNENNDRNNYRKENRYKQENNDRRENNHYRHDN